MTLSHHNKFDSTWSVGTPGAPEATGTGGEGGGTNWSGGEEGGATGVTEVGGRLTDEEVTGVFFCWRFADEWEEAVCLCVVFECFFLRLVVSKAECSSSSSSVPESDSETSSLSSCFTEITWNPLVMGNLG